MPVQVPNNSSNSSVQQQNSSPVSFNTTSSQVKQEQTNQNVQKPVCEATQSTSNTSTQIIAHTEYKPANNEVNQSQNVPVKTAEVQQTQTSKQSQPVETFNTTASKTAAGNYAQTYDSRPQGNKEPVQSQTQGSQNAISSQNNVASQRQNSQKLQLAETNTTTKSIKSDYDGQPIPIDSNGRVRSDYHSNTEPEKKIAWAYLDHNENLKPYTYNSLQPSDKAAYDQYIKDSNAYNKELTDGKSHLDDYKKVLAEYDKLTDNGNKYSTDVVQGPPCWWHGYNGWQTKDNIKYVWMAGVGFLSDTPDKDGHYLDVEPAFEMRHNALTGQTSIQNTIGGVYIGMPDGRSHCSNYIDKSGKMTVIPPKGYKFNVEESKQLEPFLTMSYKGKPMVESFTPDKIVFDFQVYADAGNQYIAPASTPIEGHPGYYKMDNGHYFQLIVTPDGQQSKSLSLDPQNKNDYQDTIDWETFITPTNTGGYGTGDRKPGTLTRSIITMPTNGQDPKKMSNADRTYVIVAPAGWQFQNIRKAKTMGADWAPFEYNDVNDTYDSDWKKGDHLTRATIDDGITQTLYATPDQAHIGFFDFNRKFMGFNGQKTFGGTVHGGYDRMWLMPDQTWKGLPGQKKDQVFFEPVSKTGAKINAENLTLALGQHKDLSQVDATDWMGKKTTAKLIKGSVDFNKAGTYQLTYENVNSFGIKSDKTILVTVKSQQQQLQPGVLDQSKAKEVGTYPWYYDIAGEKHVRFNENGIQQLSDGTYILTGNTSDAKDPKNYTDQDLVIVHLNKDFKPMDAGMRILHGGHGSTAGAIIKNGKIEIYDVLNDRSNAKGDNRVVTFEYQPGKVLDNHDSSIKVMKKIPNTGSYDGGATISKDGKYLVYSTASNIAGTDNVVFHYCKVNDDGTLTEISSIKESTFKPGSQSILQAFTFRNDDELMITYGGAGDNPQDANKMKVDPREVVGVDLKTGKDLSDDNLDFAHNKIYGITGATTAEPEGISVSNDGKGVYVCVGTWQKGINYDDKTPQDMSGKIYYIPFTQSKAEPVKPDSKPTQNCSSSDKHSENDSNNKNHKTDANSGQKPSSDNKNNGSANKGGNTANNEKPSTDKDSSTKAIISGDKETNITNGSNANGSTTKPAGPTTKPESQSKPANDFSDGSNGSANGQNGSSAMAGGNSTTPGKTESDVDKNSSANAGKGGQAQSQSQNGSKTTVDGNVKTESSSNSGPADSIVDNDKANGGRAQFQTEQQHVYHVGQQGQSSSAVSEPAGISSVSVSATASSTGATAQSSTSSSSASPSALPETGMANEGIGFAAAALALAGVSMLGKKDKE